ncbi:TraX family protein [Anaerosporobacter sp.]
MESESKKKGLTGFQLKYIALILMVMDHIHYFFEFTGKVPDWFSMLGRLSAPLFLFCVVEGFIHTHNRRKYFLRMYALSIGMGIFQYICLMYGVTRPDGFYPQNAILANFVILLVILQGIVWIRDKRWCKGIVAVVLPVLYPFIAMAILTRVPSLGRIISLLHFTLLPMHSALTDGGSAFILCGIVLYLARKNRKVQAISFAATALILDIGMVYLMLPGVTIHQLVFQYYEWFEAFAAVFMLFYNGERGKGSQKLFYWFYPVHVYVLFGLSCVLYGVLR